MCRFVVICAWNEQVGEFSSGTGFFPYWIFSFVAGSCKAGTIHVCVGPRGYGLATFLKGCISCGIRLVDLGLCSPRPRLLLRVGSPDRVLQSLCWT